MIIQSVLYCKRYFDEYKKVYKVLFFYKITIINSKTHRKDFNVLIGHIMRKAGKGQVLDDPDEWFNEPQISLGLNTRSQEQ